MSSGRTFWSRAPGVEAGAWGGLGAVVAGAAVPDPLAEGRGAAAAGLCAAGAGAGAGAGAVTGGTVGAGTAGSAGGPGLAAGRVALLAAPEVAGLCIDG